MISAKAFGLNEGDEPEGVRAVRPWPYADVLLDYKKVKSPSTTFVYSEAYHTTQGKLWSNFGLSSGEKSKVSFHHGDRSNAAFADGHCSALDVSYLKKIKTDYSYSVISVYRGFGFTSTDL